MHTKNICIRPEEERKMCEFRGGATWGGGGGGGARARRPEL